MFLAFSKNKPKRKMLETATKNFRYFVSEVFLLITQNFLHCDDVFQNLLPQSL